MTPTALEQKSSTDTATTDRSRLLPQDEPDKRLVVTLGPEAAAATRKIAADLGISPSEAVRRGLMLLDLHSSLGADEELAVRNRKTDQWERLRFHWGY